LDAARTRLARRLPSLTSRDPTALNQSTRAGHSDVAATLRLQKPTLSVPTARVVRPLLAAATTAR
jgi:hypothetical protein